jgi:hypothetical protein
VGYYLSLAATISLVALWLSSSEQVRDFEA